MILITFITMLVIILVTTVIINNMSKIPYNFYIFKQFSKQEIISAFSNDFNVNINIF